MDEADKLCDRIAIVDHGELVALDSPLKLKASIPGKNVLEVSFAARAGGLGRDARRRCRTSRTSTEHESSSGFPRQRSGDDAGADGSRRATRSVTVHSLSVQSTTLDDVFVHYTGRALRDALQEASPQDSPFMMREELDHATNTGHHRTRAAPLPAQPAC